MPKKTKALLVAAIFVAVLGTVTYLWWNSPVRAATRALLSLVDTLQVAESDSQISRQGKAARLGRAIANPVDIKFKEAGREGAWSAESLQTRYLSGALSAKLITAELTDLEAELNAEGKVLITAILDARYAGSGATERAIHRPGRWIMENRGGNWTIASFREVEAGAEE